MDGGFGEVFGGGCQGVVGGLQGQVFGRTYGVGCLAGVVHCGLGSPGGVKHVHPHRVALQRPRRARPVRRANVGLCRPDLRNMAAVWKWWRWVVVMVGGGGGGGDGGWWCWWWLWLCDGWWMVGGGWWEEKEVVVVVVVVTAGGGGW